MPALLSYRKESHVLGSAWVSLMVLLLAIGAMTYCFIVAVGIAAEPGRKASYEPLGVAIDLSRAGTTELHFQIPYDMWWTYLPIQIEGETIPVSEINLQLKGRIRIFDGQGAKRYDSNLYLTRSIGGRPSLFATDRNLSKGAYRLVIEVIHPAQVLASRPQVISARHQIFPEEYLPLIPLAMVVLGCMVVAIVFAVKTIRQWHVLPQGRP